MSPLRRTLLVLAIAVLLVAGCGSDDPSTDTGATASPARPTVVVTTTALGDVVENLAGDQLDVVTLMPVGADPHDFQASAQQAEEIRQADALVANGGGLEEGLVDVIEAAEADGVPTYEAITAVETIELGESIGDDDNAETYDHNEDEAAGEDRDHEEGEARSDDEEQSTASTTEHDEDDNIEGEDHDHEHSGVDPHFFLDPASMAVAAEGISGFLAETVAGIDEAALAASTAAYVGELDALDAEVEATLSAIPEEGRVLVTNHDALGYFADRYGFEVIGTVIPSGSTADGASAQQMAELAEVVAAEGVPAIFADNSASSDLADALASEGGDDVEVVELFTGSLGEDGTGGEIYVLMIRTNAERIADALS